MDKYNCVSQYTNTNNEVINFNYHKRLSYSETIHVIKRIADSCFDKDGVYLGYFYDFALVQLITLGYTDIELPEDTDDRYEFLCETKLDKLILGYYDDVKRQETFTILDREQIDFIKDESWQLVKYRKEKSLNKSSLDDLFNAITTYITTMTSQFNGLNIEDIKGFSEIGETLKNIDKNEFMEKVIKFAKGDDM